MWGLWWTNRPLGRLCPSTLVSSANHHSTNFSIIITHPGAGTISLLVAAVPSGPNWTSPPHYTKAPNTLWIGGLVRPTVGLDTVSEKKHRFPLPKIDSMLHVINFCNGKFLREILIRARMEPVPLTLLLPPPPPPLHVVVLLLLNICFIKSSQLHSLDGRLCNPSTNIST
jgi:hypothetical protein